MNNRKWLTAWAPLLALACFSHVSRADLVVLNETFEGAAFGTYTTVAITGTAFTVQGGTVGILAAAACTPAPSGQCAELFPASTLTSNSSFAAGTYTLS